jgi:hypothetical protein
MKKIFLLLLLIPIGCNVKNNNKLVIKSDLVLENIQGNVHSLKEFSYKAKENFGSLTKGERVRRNTLEHDFYNIYDRNGRKIEENIYDDYSDGGLIYKLVFSYGKNGNLIEGNYYNTNNEFLRKQTYVYDKFGNMIEKASTNFDGSFGGKSTFKYDDFGNKIEEIIYSTPNQSLKTTCQYDSVRNKTEENYYNIKGVLHASIKYKYDKRRLVIEEDNKNELYSIKTSYKYDINGNKIEENSEGSFLGEKLIFKYDYDRHHNWTRQVVFKENKPIYIVEREILYYE